VPLLIAVLPVSGANLAFYFSHTLGRAGHHGVCSLSVLIAGLALFFAIHVVPMLPALRGGLPAFGAA
jgi:hypothetical protein